jgi:hypothetical protein
VGRSDEKVFAVLSSTWLLLAFSSAVIHAQAPATPPVSSGATVVEMGHFQLHKFEQLIGKSHTS